ncbi:MAG: hypothetical protein WBD63_08295 [Phycisphaerae bacterium]
MAVATAEREYFETLLNFNRAFTELGRAQGTLLESAGIELIDPEAKSASRSRPLHRPPIRVDYPWQKVRESLDIIGLS